MAHVKGLNSLRAVLAITVTMCHIYMVDVWTTAPLSILIKKIYILLSYGPAAVLGFFVVSGFCIHYGNADDPFEPTVFYRRRYVRITIPLAVAVSLALGIHISYLPWNSVTWSLACEEIYYFIYPIFRNRFFPRIGILKNVLLAYAVGYLVLVGTDYHHSLIGTLRLAIGYFPAWLLGCALAEQWKRQNRTSPPKPSNWLSSVWDIGVLYGFVGIILIAKNHWPYEWVMPIFGFGFFVWLRYLMRKGKLPSCRFLEWVGEWSYSIYIIHTLGIRWIVILRETLSFPLITDAFTIYTVSGWLLTFMFIMIVCYLFYWTIELPSHHWVKTSTFFSSKPMPNSVMRSNQHPI